MKHLRINPDAHVEAEINSALGIDPWMDDPDVAKHAAREEKSEESPRLTGSHQAQAILAAIQRSRNTHTLQSTDYVDKAPKRNRAELRGAK
ncbi:MAG TPA: hypothetical protein QF549_02930 [Candidatus Saccharimonadaceae bacterium]|nr:hypothetical protein [Candidatus Saccharimonadaceae bacterium]